MQESKLSLGTAQFGHPYGIANKGNIISDLELEKIMQLTKKFNITSFDTAVLYGDAESRLGKYSLNECKIVSKLPEIELNSSSIYEWMINITESSLKRLNISSLYGLLLHRTDILKKIEGKVVYNSLCRLKNIGKVDKIGLSIYSADELESLDPTMSFDIIQIPLNIIDHRLIDSGWLYKLYEKGIEIHARSIFLQGLLLMGNERPEKFNHWSTLWDKWDKWLIENNLSALEACLRYVLSMKEIKKVIVGVDSSEHLLEILNTIQGKVKTLDIPESLKTTDVNLLNPSYWCKF